MDLQSIGLPHSEIPGSGVICTSPGLIAAYHVLLRLREPRHPPVALSYFFLAVRTRNSSAAKDGGFGTCSIQLRVVFNLAIKFWILIVPAIGWRASSLSTSLLKTFLNMSKIVDSCESLGMPAASDCLVPLGILGP